MLSFSRVADKKRLNVKIRHGPAFNIVEKTTKSLLCRMRKTFFVPEFPCETMLQLPLASSKMASVKVMGQSEYGTFFVSLAAKEKVGKFKRKIRAIVQTMRIMRSFFLSYRKYYCATRSGCAVILKHIKSNAANSSYVIGSYCSLFLYLSPIIRCDVNLSLG